MLRVEHYMDCSRGGAVALHSSQSGGRGRSFPTFSGRIRLLGRAIDVARCIAPARPCETWAPHNATFSS